MEKELFIAILIETGKTEKEAKNYLKNGTEIYTESEKGDFIKNCIGGLFDEKEAVEMWEKLDTLKYKGVVYKIDYVL